MSQETFEISVNIDEHFDVSFNLVVGVLGLILKVFGN